MLAIGATALLAFEVLLRAGRHPLGGPSIMASLGLAVSAGIFVNDWAQRTQRRSQTVALALAAATLIVVFGALFWTLESRH